MIDGPFSLTTFTLNHLTWIANTSPKSLFDVVWFNSNCSKLNDFWAPSVMSHESFIIWRVMAKSLQKTLFWNGRLSKNTDVLINGQSETRFTSFHAFVLCWTRRGKFWLRQYSQWIYWCHVVDTLEWQRLQGALWKWLDNGCALPRSWSLFGEDELFFWKGGRVREGPGRSLRIWKFGSGIMIDCSFVFFVCGFYVTFLTSLRRILA